MYYSDTITDTAFSSTNGTGTHLGYGDAKLAELRFTNCAEAVVAAYLLEKLTSRGNAIVEDINERLGSVIAAEIAAEQPEANEFHLEDVEATEVRRAIGEVAVGNRQLDGVPRSVIRAAQQMHYGAEAHEIGSMMPTPSVPIGFESDKAPQSLRAAITDIALLKTLPLSPFEPATHSAEMAFYLDRMLDSVEQPVAA